MGREIQKLNSKSRSWLMHNIEQKKSFMYCNCLYTTDFFLFVIDGLQSKKSTLTKSSSHKKVVTLTPTAKTCNFCQTKVCKNSRILACKHMFCMACLKPFINPKNVLSCPTCQKEFHIPQGDLNTLPTDDNNIMMPCSNCLQDEQNDNEEEEQAAKNVLCLHCEKVYCSKCFSLHIGQLKSHLSEWSAKLEHASDNLKNSVEVSNF